MWRSLVLTVGVLVALGGAGCAEAEPGGPGDASPPPMTPAATTTLPSGQTFVLVAGVEGDALRVDPAEFLSGDEALAAARADGAIPAGETLPNDFYIRNAEPDDRLVPVAADARFTLIGFDATGGLADVEVDRAALFAALAGEDAERYYSVILPGFPMQIEVEAGVVTGGRQQYVP